MTEEILRRALTVLVREPPNLDDCESYQVFRKKLKIWQQATGLTDRQQAVQVISTMRDDHKLKKNLSKNLFKTLTEDEVDNPKMGYIFQFLDVQFHYSPILSVEDMEVD